MGLKIVSTYKGIPGYIQAVKSDIQADHKEHWYQYIIKPHWSQWAEGQFNEQRIKGELSNPIKDTEKLEQAFNIIEASELELIINQTYEKITTLLPPPESDCAISIYIDTNLGEDVHGVVGSCVGDNILLKLNPLIIGWETYIPWVMAHEHHHCVWGYNYFFIKGNRSMNLLTAIVNEGQADSFAKRVSNDDVYPNWINALTKEEEKQQWKIMNQYLMGEDNMEVHTRFFFGDKSTNTPKCTGYTIGYNIIQSYLTNNPDVGFDKLLDKEINEILEESKYIGE